MQPEHRCNWEAHTGTTTGKVEKKKAEWIVVQRNELEWKSTDKYGKKLGWCRLKGLKKEEAEWGGVKRNCVRWSGKDRVGRVEWRGRKKSGIGWVGMKTAHFSLLMDCPVSTYILFQFMLLIRSQVVGPIHMLKLYGTK